MFNNCLMDGELNCATDGCGTFYQPNENSGAYVVYTVNNSYYHTAYGAGQGTQTDETGENLKAHLGDSWAVTADEAVVPFVNTHDLCYAKLTLEHPAYPYTGSAITVGHTVKNIFDVVLTEDTDYTVTFENAEGTQLTEVTELGEYLLTINGTGDSMGSKSILFYVYEPINGEDFPFLVDDDFQFDADGYYYVKMPYPGQIDWDDNINDWGVVGAEENPKIVNIPAVFKRSFKVYDDGGKDIEGAYTGNYTMYNQDDEGPRTTLTLNCPEGFNFRVQGLVATGDFIDEHTLTIYDGNAVGNGDVLLDHVHGEHSVGPFVTSGNSITFYFEAIGYRVMDAKGFDLTVQIIEAVPPTSLANDDSELEDSDKNTSVIAANDGEQINVTLDGRTLYKDGTWNTLCLPFDIPNIAYTPLKGAKVKALNSTNYSGGTLTLDFSRNLTSLEAGKPYIVKWDASETEIHCTALQGSDMKLVDNDDYSSWYVSPGENAFCEFFTSELMHVTGYSLETSWYSNGYRPIQWTLKGKLNESDEWTLLDSRNATSNPDDMLPETADDYGVKTYDLANSDTYRYFRFEVLEGEDYGVTLKELKLVGEPVLEDIVNPTFRGVTIKDELHPVESGGVTFEGNYSKLASTDGLLLDAHNAGGNAFHATLSLPDIALFTDAEHTTPVTGAAIPFAADGTVKLYYVQNDLALILHDDDSGELVSNNDLIAAKDGEFAVVTLDGRTLYKDGTWNTISLPFDIADINHSPLKGATVKAFALERTENNDGALTLNFSEDDLTSIEAGKPYIVKWEYVDFPAVNPSENILNRLGFIGEIPTLEYIDDTDDALLIDGDTDSQCYNYSGEPYVVFYYDIPITPTGYALWTASEGDGEYNPASWTISAWNEGDEDWTELVTVNNENGDKLPATNSTCTLFELDNSTAYKYFCFTAKGTEIHSDYYDYYHSIQLSELQFFTARPNTDIVNPVFEGVTIKSQTETPNNIFFEGSYSTLASTDGQMLDAHNTGGKAFHAALNLSSLNAGSYDFNCYTDAEHTTPVSGTIPFNATTGSVTLYPTWALTLNNNDLQAAANEKNADIISEAVDAPTMCDVTLAGRTLYKDGDWNTLCLPFDLGNPQAGEGHYFDGTLLEGATVMMLASTEFEDGVLKMNFVNVPMVVAGFPCIVKWTKADGYDTADPATRDLVNPVFTGVTISNATASHIPTDYVNFVGTYNSVVFAEQEMHKDVLFLGGGSSLYYPDGTSATTINSCRGYFHLNGITAGDPQTGGDVKAFVLNFGDGTDNIGEVKSERVKSEKSDDALYDLSGRKIENGRPTQRGIYIHKGRKVTIK